ncbi:MAG: Fic family protein [Acidithiobacillus sp.]
MPRFTDNLDPDVRDILLSQIRNLWSHTSTALEGNQLSLGDTAFLLEEGLTISGKSLKDHQEVVGHARAIDLIYGLLESHRKILAQDLFDLHRAVQTDVVVDIYRPIGKWKNEPNFTSYVGQDGKQHWREYPHPQHIPQLVTEWLEHLNAPLQQADGDRCLPGKYADLHLEFVTIHPFFDGNGRLARLLANLPVLKAGFPPIVVPAEARRPYLATLSEYQETIPHLAELTCLDELPENSQRERFRELCRGFWEETLELVKNARTMQQEKVRERKPISQPPSKITRKGPEL